MRGVELDGNDLTAIHKAGGEAAPRARAGEGPTVLEYLTCRARPHVEGMGDFTYRKGEEVEEWRRRCPIARLKRLLLQAGVDDDEKMTALEAVIEGQVEDAHRFAEQSTPPDPATAIIQPVEAGRALRSTASGRSADLCNRRTESAPPLRPKWRMP
jgi:2-oxoisovalerate dehydrogenase E1 component